MIFKNAQFAFEYYYKKIQEHGIDFNQTKTIFNEGFLILNPLDNKINSSFRNWNYDYALAEWNWYLSGDCNLNKLKSLYGKIPIIWQKMADINNNVNSNYGWQWNRNDQLLKVIEKLLDNKNTRQASISIYDGKEIDNYLNDTPCTYSINFTVIDNKLNMSVLMRSNDLWHGFCNDQFCFSKLHELVCKQTNIKIGTYYHFAQNFHIYNNHLNKN